LPLCRGWPIFRVPGKKGGNPYKGEKGGKGGGERERERKKKEREGEGKEREGKGKEKGRGKGMTPFLSFLSIVKAGGLAP
jgi:hypothetical protein